MARPAGRMRRRLRHLFWQSPLYRLSPGRARGESPRVPWRDPWPGDAEQGARLVRGEFAFRGTARPWGNGKTDASWAPADAPVDWIADLNGFVWLRDLRVIGTDAARQRARVWMGRWIDDHGRWHPLAWRPDVLGRRLASWLGHYDFYVASADDDFRRRVLASAEVQARHLARALLGEILGAGAIAAIKGLIAAGVALDGAEGLIARALRSLAREVESQVLPDGGHVERNPALQLAVLQDLVDVRALLLAGQREVPEALQRAIDRMAPMLRFFRHGDGRLALFNGATEGDREAIDLALSLAMARGRAPASAPYAGYQRLSANRTLVIADVGAPPPPGLDTRAHAGALSFEMSAAKHRLVVNCGAHVGASPAWWKALSATAAHSTVTVADVNSAEVLGEGGLGRAPSRVGCSRDEANGNIWIEAEHDGYLERLGVTHRRRLYLAAEGDDLRGEDVLLGGPGHAFAVRFHLHPTVQASLVQNGAAALLKLPGGAGWRLRADGGRLGLQESIYLGDGLNPKHCEQVTITGTTAGEGRTVVKWALGRVKA
ncbi:MAG: heparinase II/III family protein [Proteobacteria bacterium]|nr:heparinase II/III family protein [Pseudomonadota bacterium]